MDEYLFITLAKLKADRLKLQREQHQLELPVEVPQHSTKHIAKQSPKPNWFFARPFMERAVMKKTVLTLAASLAINVAVLAAYERSVDQDQARLAPAGEVTVTQLVDSAEAALFAQADGQLVATGSGSL